jgi:hypothetical protein
LGGTRDHSQPKTLVGCPIRKGHERGISGSKVPPVIIKQQGVLANFLREDVFGETGNEHY